MDPRPEALPAEVGIDPGLCTVSPDSEQCEELQAESSRGHQRLIRVRIWFYRDKKTQGSLNS